MSDLAERLGALKEANTGLTDQQAKDAFLSALEEGKTVPEAAKEAERTQTWFRAKRNPKARTYDVDFSNRYDEIMAPGGPNSEGLGLRGLTNLAKASDEGNVRASEKLMAAYHADFPWLKNAVAQGALNVEQLQVFFGELPLAELKRLQEAREAKKMKELPVIDR